MKQYLFFVLGCLLFSGCATVLSETQVRRNGTWVRKVTFTVPIESADTPGLKPKTMDEYFQLPKAPLWKTRKEINQKDSQELFIAQREMGAFQELSGDIIVLDEKRKPILQNSVNVREIEPGKLEYRENFSWHGKKQTFEVERKEALAKIKQALPAYHRKDEVAQKILAGLEKEIWRVIFGPGDPILSQMMTHPSILERRLRKKLFIAADRVLVSVLAGKLTQAEREQVVRKLVEQADLQKSAGMSEVKRASNVEPDSKGLVEICMSVKLPGKILRTNGEIDPLTGEVFWVMYPEAAAIGGVELFAVCEVAKS